MTRRNGQLGLLVRRLVLIKRRKLSGSLAQLLGPAALLLLVNVWRIFVASSSGTVAPFPHPAQPLSPSLGDVFTASQFKGVVKDEAWSPGGPRLLYTPTNARTDAVMAHFRTLLDESAGEPVSSTHVPMAGFATEAEAIAEYNKHPKLHLGVVVFQLWPRDRQHQSTHRWLYKIRLGGRSAPPTGARFVRAGDPEGVTGGAASDSWKAWSDSGFLQLQQAIDAAIVAFEGSTHPTLPHRLFKQLPSGVDGATVRSTWERLVDALMPMFGVSMGAGVLLQQFVAEKELKIRDGMLVMGVHDATYYFAWLLVSGAIQLAAMTLFTLVAAVTVFPESNALVLWIVFVLVGMAWMCVALGFGNLFRRSKSARDANAITPIAMLLIVGLVFLLGDHSTLVHTALCVLFPPTGLAVAWVTMLSLEDRGVGVSWAGMWEAHSDSPTLGAIVLALAGGLVLWLFYSFWLHNVKKREFGTSRESWFFLSTSFWRDLCCGVAVDESEEENVRPKSTTTTPRPNSGRYSLRDLASPRPGASPLPGASPRPIAGAGAGAGAGTGARPASVHIKAPAMDVDLDAPPHQPLPPELQPREAASLVLDDLLKVFGGTDIAVNRMSLRMFEGECLALLGANGAGKSTTIGMMVGWFVPSSGQITFLGRNIDDADSREWMRRRTGFVPQLDQLAEGLTGREQAEFYARIKGVREEDVAAEAAEWLEKVGLMEDGVEDKPVASYSGGMRRKLSVAIAFLGDPALVLLDEPTAGMDPASRRRVWDIIQQAKPGRTMLITSHFLDECELLGDRVAIMRHGELYCSGSSLFLKHYFQLRYTLTLTRDVASDTNDDTHAGGDGEQKAAAPVVAGAANAGGSPPVRPFPVKRATEIVKQHVPQAELESSDADSIVFTLPLGSTPLFPAVLNAFHEPEDDDASNGGRSGTSERWLPGLNGMTLQVATLDHVFQKIVAADKKKAKSNTVAVPGAAGAKPDRKIRCVSSRFAMGVEVPMDDLHQHPVLTQPRRRTATWCAQASATFKLLKRMLLHGPAFAFWGVVYPVILLVGGVLLSTAVSSVLTTPSTAFLFPSELAPPAAAVDSLVAPMPVYVGPATMPATGTCGTTVASLIDTFYTPASVADCGLRRFDTLADADAHAISRGNAMLHTGPGNASLAPLTGGFFDQSPSPGIDPPLSSLGVLFNASFLPSIAVAQGLLDSLLVANVTGWSGGGFRLRSGQVLHANHPLPHRQSPSVGFAVSTMISLGLGQVSMMGAFFGIHMRSRKLHTALTLMGLRRSALHAAHMLFDSLFLLFGVVIASVVMLVVKPAPFAGVRFTAWLALVISYIMAIVPFNYCVAAPFKSEEQAAALVPWLYVFLTMVPNIVISVLLIVPGMQTTGLVLQYMLSVFPHVAMSRGVSALVFMDSVVEDDGDVSAETVYSFGSVGIGSNIAFNLLGCVASTAFFIHLSFPGLCCRRNCCSRDPGLSSAATTAAAGLHTSARRLRHALRLSAGMQQVATEVMNESARIERLCSAGGEALAHGGIVLSHVSRAFDGAPQRSLKWAVRDMSLQVKPGEICSLLGTNGAGKTTSMSILTAQLAATSGNAHVGGVRVTGSPSGLSEFFDKVGFCSQHDALFTRTTCREHLQLVATINGLPHDQATSAANTLLNLFDFEEHANKNAWSVSGGTRRKLSLAMALMTQPEVLIADEATTGLDVVARRKVWQAVKAGAATRATLWSTHDMVEAASIGTMIGIVIHGQMVAVGSPSHLLSTIGNSMQVEIVCFSAADVGGVLAKLSQAFSANALVETSDRVGPHVRLKLSPLPEAPMPSLARVFEVMEATRGASTSSSGVAFYSVAQGSLETVFLELAKRYAW